ncbi:MAG: hypothetical protein AB7F59_06145 [Bdellovibrionales bacterium]
MGIQFLLKDDIQVVALDGKLTGVEEAAIRLKLDQKISQGRNYIFFSIAELDLQDTTTIKNVHLLLQYAKNRDTLCAIYGIKKNLFKHFIISPNRDIDKFETESEAREWLEKIKAERAAPKDAKKEPSQDPEKDFKAMELAQLLKSYEINFIENDYDPYRLAKLAEEYNKVPAPELIQALKKAIVDIKTHREELAKKDEELKNLSNQLHFQMSYRKAPVTASELKSKTASVSSAEGAIKQEIDQLKNEIHRLQKEAQEHKQKSQDHHQKWQSELKALENEIAQEKAKNDRAVEEMKKLEAEQVAYLEKIKSATT